MSKRLERLRCFVAHEGNEWQAYCADVDARASALTASAARALLARKLDEVIDDMHATGRRPPAARVGVRLRYQLIRMRTARAARRSTVRAAPYDFHRPPEWLPGLA